MLLFSATCTHGPGFCWAVHNNLLRHFLYCFACSRLISLWNSRSRPNKGPGCVASFCPMCLLGKLTKIFCEKKRSNHYLLIYLVFLSILGRQRYGSNERNVYFFVFRWRNTGKKGARCTSVTAGTTWSSSCCCFPFPPWRCISCAWLSPNTPSRTCRRAPTSTYSTSTHLPLPASPFVSPSPSLLGCHVEELSSSWEWHGK